MRLDWAHILRVAALIVDEYSTPVTLRQLFYQLVAREFIPNTISAYKTLSSRTADARDNGTFPKLHDFTRSIVRPLSFSGVQEALTTILSAYRTDRAKEQPFALYLGVEKRGLVQQLTEWFGRPLGVPILPMGGYASQPFRSGIANEIEAEAQNGRESVLIYAGDFDPSGEDILRNFKAHAPFHYVEHIALTPEQVNFYNLPPQMGKATDSRAAAFTRKHGALVQVELDALRPDVLRELYAEAIARYWDDDGFEESLKREAADLAELRALVGGAR